jgi:hypothetical protein
VRYIVQRRPENTQVSLAQLGERTTEVYDFKPISWHSCGRLFEPGKGQFLFALCGYPGMLGRVREKFGGVWMIFDRLAMI